LAPAAPYAKRVADAHTAPAVPPPRRHAGSGAAGEFHAAAATPMLPPPLLLAPPPPAVLAAAAGPPCPSGRPGEGALPLRLHAVFHSNAWADAPVVRRAPLLHAAQPVGAWTGGAWGAHP
jgi:hypothetical protein